MVAKKFQRLYLCFQCQAARRDWSKHCRLSGWVRNQRWRSGTGIVYEITCGSAMRDINKLQRLYICFWDRATWLHLCGYCPMSGWVVYQRWRPVPGSSGYIPQTLTWKSIWIELWCLTPKHTYSRWNFVAIMYASWVICYFITTSG